MGMVENSSASGTWKQHAFKFSKFSVYNVLLKELRKETFEEMFDVNWGL